MTRRTGSEPNDSASNHWHREYWTTEQHHRFEDRVSKDIEKLEVAVHELTRRVTLMLGGLTLIAILLPILAPFMRAVFGLDPPSGQ